jgi:hypothetical protein
MFHLAAVARGIESVYEARTFRRACNLPASGTAWNTPRAVALPVWGARGRSPQIPLT